MDYKTSRYCIDAIRAVMQEKPVPSMPEEVSLQELFAFSKMHSVEALVFRALSTLEMDDTDPVWQNWQNRAEMILTQSIVQLADRDELFASMTEAEIDLLPVKGCWLKEAYPEIADRQMSDLDMLIRVEDRAKARDVMLELGYEAEKSDIGSHHDGYEKKPYTAVELHLQLLAVGCGIKSYYDDIWQRAERMEDHLFRLSPEDEYIFYFLHMKRHMEAAGCGIRLILDSVVFRRTYPNMNRAYLHGEFEKLDVGAFVRQIEQLSDCWFVTGAQIPEELEALAESIITAGVYGQLDHMYKNRMDALKKRYKNPLVLMIAYWSERIFKPLEVMRTGFPILDKIPALLPVFWVVRVAQKLVKEPMAILSHIRQIYKEGTKHGER